jgi:hypothetical protein
MFSGNPDRESTWAAEAGLLDNMWFFSCLWKFSVFVCKTKFALDGTAFVFVFLHSDVLPSNKQLPLAKPMFPNTHVVLSQKHQCFSPSTCECPKTTQTTYFQTMRTEGIDLGGEGCIAHRFLVKNIGLFATVRQLCYCRLKTPAVSWAFANSIRKYASALSTTNVSNHKCCIVPNKLMLFTQNL